MDALTELLEIERIKKLKAKYQRCVDCKLWDEIEECFTEDAVSEYSGGKYSFSSRADIIKFLRDALHNRVISFHQVHSPEIEIVSESEATGVWYLQDYVINLDDNTTLIGAAFYYDRYRKVDGQWRIARIGYERTFEQVEDRLDAANFRLEHRWEASA